MIHCSSEVNRFIKSNIKGESTFFDLPPPSFHQQPQPQPQPTIPIHLFLFCSSSCTSTTARSHPSYTTTASHPPPASIHEVHGLFCRIVSAYISGSPRCNNMLQFTIATKEQLKLFFNFGEFILPPRSNTTSSPSTIPSSTFNHSFLLLHTSTSPPSKIPFKYHRSIYTELISRISDLILKPTYPSASPYGFEHTSFESFSTCASILFSLTSSPTP